MNLSQMISQASQAEEQETTIDDSNEQPINAGQSNPSNSSSSNNTTNSSSSSSTNSSKGMGKTETEENNQTSAKQMNTSDNSAKYKSAPIVKPHVKSVRFTKIKKINAHPINKSTIEKLKKKLPKMKDHEISLKKAHAPEKEIQACSHKMLHTFHKIVDYSSYESNHIAFIRHIRYVVKKRNMIPKTDYPRRIKFLHNKLKAVYSASASTASEEIAKANSAYYDDNISSLALKSMRAQDNRFVKSLDAEFRSRHPRAYKSKASLIRTALHKYSSAHPFRPITALHGSNNRIFSKKIPAHTNKHITDKLSKSFENKIYFYQRASMANISVSQAKKNFKNIANEYISMSSKNKNSKKSSSDSSSKSN